MTFYEPGEDKLRATAYDNAIKQIAKYTYKMKQLVSVVSSSSWKSSSNVSSVSRFLNFIKKFFSSVGVSIVFSRDCSSSVFCFLLFYGSFVAWSFLVIFFVGLFFGASAVVSLFFFIQFFSFDFSVLNIF